MSAPILIFDIETIPDIDTGKRLYPDIHALSEDDALTALQALREAEAGNSFMRLPLHKIACLSFLWIDGDTHKYVLKSLSLETMDEKNILSTFFRAFDKTPAPILVSWNGAGFDIPVLLYRALHHRLSAPKLFNTQAKFSYLNRYSEAHIDVMDKLSLYNGYNRQKLDTVAALCGYAGKQDTDGTMVVSMVQQGLWQALTTYCESDVINTWLIYLRYALLTGKYNAEQAEDFERRTYTFLATLHQTDGSLRHGAFLTNLTSPQDSSANLC